MKPASRRRPATAASREARAVSPGTLVGLVAAAFCLRVVVRLAQGPGSFFDDGYGFYLRIATTFVGGGGMCVAPDVGCALRVPGYPLLLSPFAAIGWVYPGVVILQALAAAVMVGLTYALGRDLFGTRTGLWAAVATALSPYAIVHDTALQDSLFVNFFTLLATWAAVSSVAAGGDRLPLVAGAAVSAAALTSARVALFVPALAGWFAIHRRATPRRAVLVALPIVVLVGGWMVRNWRVVGAPVLTSEAGASLYYANNEWTFRHFPSESIDLSARESVAHLSPDRRDAMAALAGDAVAEDRLARSWALQYIRDHPAAVAAGAVRKLWVVLSGEYSPARERLTQVAYRMLFLPVHVLAIVGLWRARRSGAPHGPALAVLAAFLVTTAVFWAHTSHKSVIDPVLFVYAASVLCVRAQGSGSVPRNRVQPQPEH